MNKIAKFSVMGSLLVGLSVFAGSALATNYSSVGTVAQVTSNSEYGATGGDDSLEVKGFTSAGVCAVDPSTGLVKLMIHRASTGVDGERVWAQALAAEESGKTVTVSISDQNLAPNGGCYVLWISM